MRILARCSSMVYTVAMSRLLEELRHAIRTSATSRYRIWIDTGIDQAHLSKFLRGEKGVSFETYELLADYLGMTITIRQPRRRKGR